MNCGPCFHRNRDQIDQQLVDGIPYRSIAQTFGLSLGAISRHRAHVAAMLEERTPEETEKHGSNLMRRVEDVITEAKSILVEAKANKSFGAATQALNAITRALELCGRLSGELQSANSDVINLTLSKTTVNVHSYDDDVEFAQMIGEATNGFDIAEFLRLRALAESTNSVQQPCNRPSNTLNP